MGMFRKQVWRFALAVGASAAAFMCFEQWNSGAWHAGWGTDPDAPAHMVSSIAIREYLLHGLPDFQNPVAFFHEFYQRFPKIALGHWPPVYHSALALWLLLVPPEQPWILGFQALLAGVLSMLTVLLSSRLLGVRRAVLAGMLVCLTPAVVTFGRVLSIDLMVAVWVNAGITAYAFYWKKPGWLPATLFGICAAMALLTKPSGIILAAVPPLCVLASRRWHLLRAWSFWWPAAIVLALYGPWHLAFTAEMSDGWRAPVHLTSRFVRTPWRNLVMVLRILGAAGTALAIYGAWRWRSHRVTRLLAAAVVGGFLAFAYAIPSSGYRHYVPLAPAMTILAVCGLRALLLRFRAGKDHPFAYVVLVLLLASPPPAATGSGVRAAVDQLLADRAGAQTWLVTGSPSFEGDVIAESALRRPSAGLTVYRGSKLFLRGNWAGRRDYLLIGTADEAEALIERCGIQAVFIGKGTPLLAAEAVGRNPARWRLLRTSLNPESGILFERIGPAISSPLPPVIQKP